MSAPTRPGPTRGETAERARLGRELALVCAFALLYFSMIARLRIVDDDEGYYLLAGRAWMAGELPYRDFFFPQMPLTALVYGVWGKVFGGAIASARVLCALCATLSCACVFAAARRAGGSKAGGYAAVLFAGHLLTWEWATTAKTFCLTLLLPVAALLIATGSRPSAGRSLVAGALAGLAVAARVLMLPVVPAVVLALWWGGGTAVDRARRGGWALAGAGLALTPVVMLAWADVEAFVFDNLGYHAIRSTAGARAGALVTDLPQKLGVLRTVLLAPVGSQRPDCTGLQMTPLLLAATVGTWRAHLPGGYAAFGAAAAGIALASLLPSPSWSQYFACVVPLACVPAAAWLSQLEHPGSGGAAVALAGYLGVAAPSFHDRLIARAEHERVGAVDAVGRALDDLTRPGDRVAAHWPSYLAASTREALPAARNQFARLYSERVPAQQRARLGLYTEGDLRSALEAGQARALVVGLYTVPATALGLKERGWRRAAELHGALIWVPPGERGLSR